MKYSSINKGKLNKVGLNLFHCIIKIPLFVLQEKTSQNDSGNLGEKTLLPKGSALKGGEAFKNCQAKYFHS